jgi:poly[(R)-3-hydroxyalkanoate] polymerase subunit PhaC
MRRHSNGTVSAPTAQGTENYPAIEPAPGRYVKLKSN